MSMGNGEWEGRTRKTLGLGIRKGEKPHAFHRIGSTHPDLQAMWSAHASRGLGLGQSTRGCPFPCQTPDRT